MFKPLNVILFHFSLRQISSSFKNSLLMISFFLNLSSKASYLFHIVLNYVISFLRWFYIPKKSIEFLIVLFVKNFILISFLSHFILNPYLDWNAFIWIQCEEYELIRKLSFLASWPNLKFRDFIELVRMIKVWWHRISKRRPYFKILFRRFRIIQWEFCRSWLLFTVNLHINLRLFKDFNFKPRALNKLNMATFVRNNRVYLVFQAFDHSVRVSQLVLTFILTSYVNLTWFVLNSNKSLILSSKVLILLHCFLSQELLDSHLRIWSSLSPGFRPRSAKCFEHEILFSSLNEPFGESKGSGPWWN